MIHASERETEGVQERRVEYRQEIATEIVMLESILRLLILDHLITGDVVTIH
jgi:hypothetical protein